MTRNCPDRSFTRLSNDPIAMFPEEGEPSAEDWARMANGWPSYCDHRFDSSEWKPYEDRRVCGQPMRYTVAPGNGHPELWNFSYECSGTNHMHGAGGMAVDCRTWDRPTPDRWTELNPQAFGIIGTHPPGSSGHPGGVNQQAAETGRYE